MRKRVLLTNAINERAWARLVDEADARVATAPDEAALCREVADVHGLIVRAPVSVAVLAAGPRLEVVARHGVGLDFIPVEAATARKIPVTYTPDANTESVAEHVVGAMIALAHEFRTADAAVRAGAWGQRHAIVGIDLRGRTLGVIGFGRIGSRVAEICRSAFGMRVLAFDPCLSADRLRRAGAEPARLEALLAEADFVTVHTPLTDATRGLIGVDALHRMKPGAFLINAARGPIVDPVALHGALERRELRGAALDVFTQEPPDPGDPLLRSPHVLLTPHSAAHTAEALERMGLDAVEDVLRVLRGERPRYCANPEVFS